MIGPTVYIYQTAMIYIQYIYIYISDCYGVGPIIIRPSVVFKAMVYSKNVIRIKKSNNLFLEMYFFILCPCAKTERDTC